jgi:hypothetical protein
MDKIVVSVISSSTPDAKYRQFIEPFVAAWSSLDSTQVTFAPLVLLSGSWSKMEIESHTLDRRARFESIPLEKGAATGAQVGRLFAGAFDSNEWVLLTDVDMIPINAEYFEKFVVRTICSGASFGIARDVLGHDQYPICYTLLRVDHWREALEQVGLLKSSLGDSIRHFISIGTTAQDEADKTKSSWFEDQRLLRRILDSAESELNRPVVKFQDSDLGFKRLDRIYHSPMFASWILRANRVKEFSDYHMHISRSRRMVFLSALKIS